MGDMISNVASIAGLVEKLFNLAVRIKNTLDEQKVKKDLKDSVEDAQRAFRACVPKGMAVNPTITKAFFDSKAFEAQCQRLLEGSEPDMTLLMEAFYQAGYDSDSEKIPGFDPVRAIAEFFSAFVDSAGQKETLVNVVTRRLSHQGYKRRYCQQVERAYEYLSFAGIASAYDPNPVKLEDIFVTLQASLRTPESSILAVQESGCP